MRARNYILASACLAILLVTGCPKPAQKVEPAEKTLLRYQFPRGRVLKYDTKSETRMAFTVPFIAERQISRSETFTNMAEEVIEEPLGGFALIEERVDGYRFVIYQDNKVIFDSLHPKDFPPQPQFDSLTDIKGMKVRYQMSVTGAVRSVEGFDEFSKLMTPTGLSRVFQSSKPNLPEKPVAPGQSWETVQEMPIAPSQGFKGTLTFKDNTRLVQVKVEGNSRKAVIEQTRNVSVQMERVIEEGKRKSRQASIAKGESITTILFDIDRGIVLQATGRIKVSANTETADQTSSNTLTLDIEGTINNTLVEK